MTVHGYGVCDPNKYRWRDMGVLPPWLDESERTNTMGFLRMSTRFNMKKLGQDRSSKLPASGDYPFHVLLYWPRAATFWREKKWAATIKRGGFFHVDGRTVHFVGKMIGLLKTSLLCDVPLGVFIPVIVPEQLYIVGDGGSGSGGGSSQFAGLKTRTTPKKSVKSSDVNPFGSPVVGTSSASLSPSAARGRSAQKRGPSAQKALKARMDALLGAGTATSSGAPKASGGTRDSISGGIVDPDTALQFSITDDRSGGEGSPDRFYDAPPSSQPGNAMEVDPVGSGGFDGAVDLGEAEHSDEEPRARGKKRNRAGRGTLSEKAAGKRRGGTRR
jgi:hypothetical protein